MRYRSAFSLVELLVVVAIIAVLAAIVFVVMSSSKTRAKVSVDISNMRQLAVAESLYTADNDDRRPLGVRRLLAAGYATPEIVVSPDDPFQIGLGRQMLESMRAHPTVMRAPVPKFSYIGPDEGGWKHEDFQARIAPGVNVGWLVNLVRCNIPYGAPSGARGRYQRLTTEGAVISRSRGYMSGVLDGQYEGKILSFVELFRDDDPMRERLTQPRFRMLRP
jgi:prepilin-type N-terminal cleavage/methylation domain-containing protein